LTRNYRTTSARKRAKAFGHARNFLKRTTHHGNSGLGDINILRALSAQRITVLSFEFLCILRSTLRML